MKHALIGLAVILFQGCGDGSVGVKGAKGDTHVKYVICGPGESDCFVAARFKDLDACQSHKDWAGMLCDSQSNPGKMVCTKNTHLNIAVDYCTL
jgi:hypothetical protein